MIKIFNSYLLVEKILRFTGIALAILIYIFSPGETALTTMLVFFVLSVLITLFVLNQTSKNILEKNPFLATIDVIFLILCLVLTGKSQSPFIFYLFGTFLTISRLLKVPSTFIYSSIFMLFMLADILVRNPQAFSRNSSLLVPSMLGIVILVSVVSYFISRLQEQLLPEIPPAAQAEFQPLETPLDYIWDIADLQRDMQNSYSIDSVVSFFIQFLIRLNLTGAVVVHFKKNDLLEMFTRSNDLLKTLDLEDLISKVNNQIPSELTITHDGHSYEFVNIAEIPEITVYIPHFNVEEDKFKSSLLKLTSELFAYRIAEMTLQSKEKILLARFSSLREAVKELSRTIEPRPILEAAAQAIKGLTGMEKSLVMLATSPEEVELDFSRTVIKGKIAEHPETFWRDPLIDAGKKCLSILEPVFSPLASDESHLVCVPIFFQKKVFGLVAGITSLPKEEILGDLRTLEVIAALTATSLANLELMKMREKELTDEEKNLVARQINEKLLISLYEALFEIEKAIGESRKDARISLKNLHSLKTHIQNTIRDFRKYIFELYPEARKTIGLRSALEKVISSFDKPQEFFQLSMEVSGEIPVDIENALMRIVYEASSNSIFHGEATGVEISIAGDKDQIELVIKDNGCGFSPKDAIARIKEERKVGIRSMFDNVKTLGGNLQILSAPGKGTVVKARIPLEFGNQHSYVIQESGDS